MSETDPKIRVTENGPYIVEGPVPISKQSIVADDSGECVRWDEGERFPGKSASVLCRCGASKRKPYCDGAHIATGFDGTETADRSPCRDRADVIEGPILMLTDAADLCGEARFCDAHGGLWNRVLTAETDEECEDVAAQTGLCPTGRYTVWEKKTNTAIEPEFEQSIGLVEDPQEGAGGGLWVRGSIPVLSADGFTYEVRNRVTLCRCGGSKNKPFCDGTHLRVHFSDGL